MIKTSDFLGVVRGQYRYLFFLIGESYWLQSDAGREFSRIFEDVFAREIGNDAAVVTSFYADHDRNHQCILEKPWTQEVLEEIRDSHTPKVLVITTDFGTFDPREDRFALVEIPTEGLRSTKGPVLLRDITNALQQGWDLVEWAQRNGSAVREAGRRFGEAISVKPGLFGVSIDLKKLLAKRD